MSLMSRLAPCFFRHTQSWDRAVEVTEIHLKVSLPLQSNASSVPRKELHFFSEFFISNGLGSLQSRTRNERGVQNAVELRLKIDERVR